MTQSVNQRSVNQQNWGDDDQATSHRSQKISHNTSDTNLYIKSSAAITGLSNPKQHYETSREHTHTAQEKVPILLNHKLIVKRKLWHVGMPSLEFIFRENFQLKVQEVVHR